MKTPDSPSISRRNFTKLAAASSVFSLIPGHVMCANDLVGAWGAAAVMRKWNLDISVLSGPATDNEVGLAGALEILEFGNSQLLQFR